uniref:Uncharacterized protein n=1 Tax=Anguilla anguilla TaxID=7936 RepID=A0A0E9Q2X0_ANGAN
MISTTTTNTQDSHKLPSVFIKWCLYHSTVTHILFHVGSYCHFCCRGYTRNPLL